MGAQNNDNSVDYAKKAKSLPASTQFAIVTVLPNIANGAFWGFTTVTDAKKHAEELKKDFNIQLRRVGKDVIVEVAPNYLMSATASVDAGLITQKDIDRMTDFSAKAVVEFEKFLLNKGKKGFSGLVGIYCTNDTTSISYKGTSYPSFRLPISKVMQICNTFKYMIKLNGQWVSPSQAMSAGQSLFDSLIVSPTKTGVFMEIRSTASPEELKQIEARMKGNTKKPAK